MQIFRRQCDVAPNIPIHSNLTQRKGLVRTQKVCDYTITTSSIAAFSVSWLRIERR